MDFGAYGTFTASNFPDERRPELVFTGPIAKDTVLANFAWCSSSRSPTMRHGILLSQYRERCHRHGQRGADDLRERHRVRPAYQRRGLHRARILNPNATGDGSQQSTVPDNEGNYPLTFATPNTSNVWSGLVIPANSCRSRRTSTAASPATGTTPSRRSTPPSCPARPPGPAPPAPVGAERHRPCRLPRHWHLEKSAEVPALPRSRPPRGQPTPASPSAARRVTKSIISWVSNLPCHCRSSTPVTSTTICYGRSSTSATLATTPGAFYEVTMTVAATIAGTLQLQVYNGTTNDDTGTGRRVPGGDPGCLTLKWPPPPLTRFSSRCPSTRRRSPQRDHLPCSARRRRAAPSTARATAALTGFTSPSAPRARCKARLALLAVRPKDLQLPTATIALYTDPRASPADRRRWSRATLATWLTGPGGSAASGGSSWCYAAFTQPAVTVVRH